jgi:acylphosphatase
MKRLHIIVSGHVQGVGYRSFVHFEAIKRQLTGWVRNNYDRTVELEVQGEDEILSSFMDILRLGTPFSKVSGLKTTEIPPIENEKSFRILY